VRHPPTSWREHYKRFRNKAWKDGTTLEQMITALVDGGGVNYLLERESNESLRRHDPPPAKKAKTKTKTKTKTKKGARAKARDAEDVRRSESRDDAFEVERGL
jgi:hypothetical protein